MELLILDNDGTLTLLGPEFAGFEQAFLERVQRRSGLGHESFAALLAEQRVRVYQEPHRHGWRHKRYLAAAATVDPNVELRAVCELTLGACRALPTAQAIADELDSYFRELNQLIKTHLRPETPSLMRVLAQAKFPSYVVTNSHPTRVRQCLGEIHPAWPDRVFGHACKNQIIPWFYTIPDCSFALPGFQRRMPLRRRPYYTILNMLRLKHGVEWSDMVVVGDIFEIDLLLPWYMGAQVVLIDHELIPGYERAFIAHHERLHLVTSPAEVLSLFAHHLP